VAKDYVMYITHIHEL